MYEEPNNKIKETLLTRCVAMSVFLFFGSSLLLSALSNFMFGLQDKFKNKSPGPGKSHMSH